MINNMQDELFTIPQDFLEEMIENHFENVLCKTEIDNSLIMEFMMKVRKMNDIFELLESERNRSMEIFEKLHFKGLEPTIQWKIKSSDPNSGFYKESEEFNLENIKLILINYYDAENDVYSIALKLCERNEEETLYNAGKEILYSSTNASQLDKLKESSQTSDSFISLLSVCEIKEINYKSKINFTCVFSNMKTKILACKIEKFSSYFLDNGINFDKNLDYTVSIYFNLSYNFSGILSHICKNFYQYHKLTSISKIPKNMLNIILKNEKLNLRSEEEVLYSILSWVQNKPNLSVNSLSELTNNINWNLLSLDCLLNLILTESKLLQSSKELQESLIQEFIRRFIADINTGPGSIRTTAQKERSHSVINRTQRQFDTNKANISSRNNFRKSEENSFTADLITKLITGKDLSAKNESNNKNKSGFLTNVSNKNEIHQRGFGRNFSVTHFNATKDNFYSKIEKYEKKNPNHTVENSVFGHNSKHPVDRSYNVLSLSRHHSTMNLKTPKKIHINISNAHLTQSLPSEIFKHIKKNDEKEKNKKLQRNNSCVLSSPKKSNCGYKIDNLKLIKVPEKNIISGNSKFSLSKVISTIIQTKQSKDSQNEKIIIKKISNKENRKLLHKNENKKSNEKISEGVGEKSNSKLNSKENNKIYLNPYTNLETYKEYFKSKCQDQNNSHNKNFSTMDNSKMTEKIFNMCNVLTTTFNISKKLEEKISK